jgi:hypothetical protein
VQAIRAAADGHALIAPSVTTRLLQSFADTGRAESPRDPIEALTPREEEVLRTVAKRRTNSEIANELRCEFMLGRLVPGCVKVLPSDPRSLTLTNIALIFENRSGGLGGISNWPVWPQLQSAAPRGKGSL